METEITEQANIKGIPDGLTPREIVKRLDNYIIGQAKAKRFVAVALRNRQRRIKLSEDIRDEVAPKNILMMGPTGCGKTEIARRLAKLCGAPFLKVEATKYTEVGYVGRDVESMVRDLMAVGFNMVKSEMQEKLKAKCEPIVEEKLLDLLLPGSASKKTDSRKKDTSKGINVLGNIFGQGSPISGSVIQIDLPVKKNADGTMEPFIEENSEEHEEKIESTISEEEKNSMAATREKFRQLLRDGKLEERQVEVSVARKAPIGLGMMGISNPEELEESINGLQQLLNGGNKSKKKTVTVKEAREILMAETLETQTDTDKVSDEAKKRVEQSGIIFIDEIDKIASKGGEGDRQAVSREGVQRDILPIVEGCDVNTKWGVVNTTHILFIGAGAFSLSAPSDLIPELQGRFPLRVELEALTKDDFKRILTEPKNALIKQYEALLKTEGLTLKFSDDAIDRMSSIAEDVNNHAENIGARRLHTIMETVLEELSFDADIHSGETVTIDSKYVDEKLGNVVQNQNLERYIL